MILVLGALVTLYTMLGGIQAVIWNDVMQFFIMFGGLAATVWISLTHVPGGVVEVWEKMPMAGAAARAAAAPHAAGTLAGSIQAFFLEPINVTAVVVAIVVGRRVR